MLRDVVKQGRIPHGVADTFYEDAAAITALERALHDLFTGWGYARIIPPTFEYYDMLVTQASEQLQDEVFRFFDREGQMLALRPDMTVQTARIAGSKLYDQALPLRFYYIGHVFRYEEPQAGKQREFTQAGIELLGADTALADAEALSLTIEALHQLGLRDFQINLGHIGYLAATLADVSLADAQRRNLELTIERRNPRDLAQVLDEYQIPKDIANVIRRLPHLSGDKHILQEAHALAINRDSAAALERLEQVYTILDQAGLSQHIILDLGEIRNMSYYTGIVFRGYISGLGFPVCGGGRYDTLVRNFGADLPAVGFALSLERVLSVTKAKEPIAPDILVQWGYHPLCAEQVNRMRKLGLRVEVDVLNRQETELVAYAQQRRVRRVLLCTDTAEFKLIEGSQSRWLSSEQLLGEMVLWKS
ncbi:MAG: ATP phosphoribosyltransferase regulatory subunit [Chloroflexi bacterium]|nr:ATP phosphoribosyltransferase regulatory subunit [Chloroflexota bacterium]